MNNKDTLSRPEFPQKNSDGIINVPEIIAMCTNYIMMKVNKYQGVEVLDKIDGEIYLKNNTKAKVKSITHHITPEEPERDFYILLFDVNKIDISGVCEAKYTVTNLHKEHLYSKTSLVTIIGGGHMASSDNEIIFRDAKKSKLYLHDINLEGGVRVRAKFKGLVNYDSIVISAKFLGDFDEQVKELNSGQLTLHGDDITNGYVDYTFKIDGINFLEVKSVIAKFSAPGKGIESDYTSVFIFNDLDTVNVKVQTTKNIGSIDSEHADIKPFLTAVIYTGSNSKPIHARLTNAYFGDNDGENNIVLDNINEKGVGYLHIYSEDISKNSVLILNYEDPVIAYKVPLDFSTWMLSSDEGLTYTYSSYGVADGMCQCFLLIKISSDKITDIIVEFESVDIKINGGNNVLEIPNPDKNKVLVYNLTSFKAVRSAFTINVKGISIEQINNTIVFVDPLTL
ncbi:hypothetical protein [Xenorhabdus sp. KJ12.1]|uniref:hypothetical protein n=1 Tax=Xenorhabdus sp. KJ12.1 TaxID=1851571 RepID=UPI000C04A551|nr:hypothetical protein [Xenorhabdus sp. KJ12.1]PHM69772.1 hypothetical protein Xekj_02275 [Xenorhabdus sp. KJ12.1]